MSRLSGVRRLDSLWLIVESKTQDHRLSAGLYQRDVSHRDNKNQAQLFTRLQRFHDLDLQSLKDVLTRHNKRTTHAQRVATYWVTFRSTTDVATDSRWQQHYYCQQLGDKCLYATQATLDDMAALEHNIQLIDSAVLGNESDAAGQLVLPEQITVHKNLFNWICIPEPLHKQLFDSFEQRKGWLGISIQHAFSRYSTHILSAYCVICMLLGLLSGIGLHVINDVVNQPDQAMENRPTAYGIQGMFHDPKRLDTLMQALSAATTRRNVQWSNAQMLNSRTGLQLYLISKEPIPKAAVPWPKMCVESGERRLRCDLR